MSLFRIRFGVIWRLIGMTCLTGLSISTVNFAPSSLYAAIASVACGAAIVAQIILISRMRQQDIKARFGLAMIGINLAMTLFAVVTVGLIPTLPLWAEIFLGALALWHGLVTWYRWMQYQTGSYAVLFKRKRKRPSAFQPLRDFRKSIQTN